MRREAREVWVKRIERWQDSGLTAKEFATEIGVNYQTLQHWKYRLAAEGRRDMEVAVETAPAAPTRLSFIEVPAPSPQPPASEQRFELELRGGRRLFIPSLFDATALVRIVELVEARS